MPGMTDSGNGASGARHADGVSRAGWAAEFASDASETGQPGRRRELARTVAAAARSSARAGGHGARAARRRAGRGTGWLTGQVVAMAPRLRVRDGAALRAQHPGRGHEEIAEELIDAASRASAAVGAAVGTWAALPIPPALIAELATETLAVVAIEVKLVAELHEAFGMPADGNAATRMASYLGAWAYRRGVFLVPGGLVLTAGSPVARRLRRRLAAHAGRSAFSLGPLLTGAAAGAVLNGRETRRLGRDIRADLRRRAITDTGSPP